MVIWGSRAVSTDISPSPLIIVLLNPVLIVSIPSSSTNRDSTAACWASTLRVSGHMKLKVKLPPLMVGSKSTILGSYVAHNEESCRPYLGSTPSPTSAASKFHKFRWRPYLMNVPCGITSCQDHVLWEVIILNFKMNIVEVGGHGSTFENATLLLR